jgi:hypothetical protein
MHVGGKGSVGEAQHAITTVMGNGNRGIIRAGRVNRNRRIIRWESLMEICALVNGSTTDEASCRDGC